jgi:hypothetical protein
MQQLINWAVAARKLYPNRRILATKLNVKTAYPRCHLNAAIAVQTCTQLPSEGLALMMLWLTLGGAPCPSEWGFIAESICNPANAILLSNDWDPLSLQSPAQHLVPDKVVLANDAPFGIGQDLIVNIPVDPRASTLMIGGPHEKMPFFFNASGPILSIPIHSKVCQYDPCKVSLKKNDPFLTYEPPKNSVFLALVTGLVTD